MDQDADIQQILTRIETGRHTIEETANRYLESLPGYEFRFHRPLTVKSYERCLLRDPNSFILYMNRQNIFEINLVGKDDLEFYKSFVCNKIEPTSAMKFVTAVRQLFKYAHKIGWVDSNPACEYELPRRKERKIIDVIRPEVQQLLLTGNWGCNDFTRSRNYLILCLFLRRGMHPKELPTIMLEHIEPYRDIGVITVCGKKSRWREVMCDPATWAALQSYSPFRGKYLAWRGASDEHLLLAADPSQDGSYGMSISGISAIIKRIVRELQQGGCLYSLKNVTPNIMRHSAESADWERCEHLPVKNPELSITGQYGNSPEVARKHYLRSSRRNAYILLKGGAMVDAARADGSSVPDALASLTKDFPETNCFPDYDPGI